MSSPIGLPRRQQPGGQGEGILSGTDPLAMGSVSGVLHRISCLLLLLVSCTSVYRVRRTQLVSAQCEESIVPALDENGEWTRLRAAAISDWHAVDERTGLQKVGVLNVRTFLIGAGVTSFLMGGLLFASMDLAPCFEGCGSNRSRLIGPLMVGALPMLSGVALMVAGGFWEGAEVEPE